METLVITTSIAAPREAVFKAFTEKSELEKWFCPEGMTATMDELAPKEGGTFQVTMKGEDGGTHTARGTYKEVTPPEKLSFTWAWVTEESDKEEETLVEVVLTEEGDGTIVHFTHSGFDTKESRDMHQQGWESALKKLPALLA